MERYRFSDWLITLEIIIIGLAEAAHLCGLFFGWPFSRCTLLLGGLVLAAGVVGICFWAVRQKSGSVGRRRKAPLGRDKPMGAERAVGGLELFLYALFLLLVLSQLIFIRIGDTVYMERDMTVETVGSFLAADGIYRVNPMTGLPYQVGMPLRLKILCLPTLYGSLCRATGFDLVTVVRFIVPEITLISSYAAFSALGHCLFPQDRKRHACFLAVAALLIWTGIYGYGTEGFNLLCYGWRGEAIRNCVLIPWLVSLLLRRKWPGVVLCILAEACMVWTLYGGGVCAALTLGMAGAGLCCRAYSGKEHGK